MMRILTFVLATIIFVYPFALTIQHGLELSLWPTGIPAWSDNLREFNSLGLVAAFGTMIGGNARWLSNGGWSWPALLALAPPLSLIAYWCSPRRAQPPRDSSGLFGDARFASSEDLADLERQLTEHDADHQSQQ